MEWISVEDRLPDRAGTYFIWVPACEQIGSKDHACVAFFDGPQFKEWDDHNSWALNEGASVSHWAEIIGPAGEHVGPPF